MNKIKQFKKIIINDADPNTVIYTPYHCCENLFEPI